MKEEVISVTPDTLGNKIAEMKKNGYRFVTMSCVDLDSDTVDILYHFDKNLELEHFRLTIPKSEAVPSISPIYFAAFLVENEIQDQFGIRFDGLAIDYNRTLYLEEEVQRAPNCRITDSNVEGSEGD